MKKFHTRAKSSDAPSCENKRTRLAVVHLTRHHDSTEEEEEEETERWNVFIRASQGCKQRSERSIKIQESRTSLEQNFSEAQFTSDFQNAR